MTPIRLWLTLLPFAALAAGCSTWSLSNVSSTSLKKLPSLRASPDSVSFEVVTVHLPEVAEGADDPTFWNKVDEQAISAEVRRRMRLGGFRCGVITGEIPAELRTHFEKADSADGTVIDDSQDKPNANSGGKVLQNRPGRRSKVVVSETRDQLVVLNSDGGRITGQTYYQAQCLFSVRGFPSGDGRMRLELTPEIEHGQPKQRWVGQSHDGTFRIDTSRERVQFETLSLDIVLSPGQTIVISNSPERKGLGRQFFVETPAGRLEHRLLMIRAAATQLDHLFAPSQESEPLATPID